MKHITISHALHLNSISANLISSTKNNVINELVSLLEKSGNVTNIGEVKDKIINREKIASTAIAGGIAMPHIKTNGVKDVCLAVGVSKNGILYGADDKKPSKLFVLAASPEDAESSYLITLVNFIGELKNQTVFDEITSCDSAEKIYEILLHHEHKMFDIAK